MICMIVDIHNTNKKYDIVYTDPPWPQYKSNFRKSRPNQLKSLDYETMTLEDIQVLHNQFLNNNTNQYHNVFMWTIDKYLIDTELMMNKLGYIRHCRFIWNKENGICPAFTVRFSHEYLIWFYKKGCMLKPDKDTIGKYTTVFNEKSTIHSKKPEFAYMMIEDMFPNTKKIELFARNKREDWDCWGNEIK